MALTSDQEAQVITMLAAFSNAKRINELPVADASNPFALTSEVLDATGESKQANIASMLPYIESQVAYGVQFDMTGGSPTGNRIGNLALHVSRPLQNRMIGCLQQDDGSVTEYFTDAWNNHILDGSKGQVMVELPEHYRKTWLDSNNKLNAMISEFPVPGYQFIPKMYISAYQASMQRSTGKLFSCVNATADFRGGNNSTTNDGNGASLLGTCATNLSETAFRTAARLRGSTNWNQLVYDAYLSMYWLFVVEYATLNSQASVNSALDANGYKQGGLGNGVTTIDPTKWSNFNGSSPIVKNGYTNSLGNGTGEIAYTMPFEYDSNGVANYKGSYSATTAYTTGNFVSSGTNLYICIAPTTGDGTIVVTNTTYFTPVTSTVIYVNRYRGIEMPFGHIWIWADGCKCNIETDANGGQSQFYVCENPANYQDTDFTNYVQRGLLARSAGYIKNIINGVYGDILPIAIGGGSTTYFCDSFYTDGVNDTGQRGVLFGGYAYYGAAAGLASANSFNAPSTVSAYIGSRLCFIPN
jgi:hypothetical protein